MTEDNHKSRLLFMWFAKAPQSIQCKIMERINPSPWRPQLPKEEARLNALAAAIEEIQKSLKSPGSKDSSFDLSRAGEANKLRIDLVRKSLARRNPTIEILEIHLGLIDQLACEGLSLREMQTYLKRYAQVSVSTSYLHKFVVQNDIPLKKRKSHGK